ncbi:N-acetylneuraminate synthase [Acinetobacter sp. CUI P1]|nr:N-acetylneuraminate synthase [Acinetobacter sp. CUI P1]
MSATYIIAEAGVNHNGDLLMAKHLVDIAVKSKADAVKFQTFKTELMISTHATKAEYQIQATGAAESQFEMVKKLELSFNQFAELKLYCDDCGIEFLSTPFDIESADFLIDELKLNTIKIPSGEITNAPLLYHIASKQSDIILSTGMATLSEVEQALGVIAFGLLSKNELPSASAFRSAYLSPEGQRQLQSKVRLLHCTTEYPAPVEDVNLLAIETIQRAFGLSTGYSDHTEGLAVTIAAVALGASIIEKHFTHDKQAEGPDHKASLSPEELQLLVQSIRQVEAARGNGIKIPAESEMKNISIARKSIVAHKKLKQGEQLTADNIAVKRPGGGISPFEYWSMLETAAVKDFEEGELLK